MSDDIEARRAALRARFPVWEPVTLSGFLTRSAGKYGDRPFVITDERTASYAEIDAWATRLADGLAALGVRPGDRVGVLMANYLEFVPVKFAIARAGAVAIPFNYLYRQDELGYVLRQSRCARPGHHDRLRRARLPGHAGRDRPRLGRAGRPPELPDLRRVVLLDTDGTPAGTGVLDVAGLAALGDRHPGLADACRPSGRGHPGQPGRHPVHLGHHRAAQGRRGHPRRGAADQLRLGAHPRLRRRPPDPVLAAVLPHVRLRGGAAVGDVRRRRRSSRGRPSRPPTTSPRSSGTGPPRSWPCRP